MELGETIRGVMECVDRLRPSRVVFDSLSEMRLLAQNSLRYRRQILALKQYFSTRECTVLLLDDRSSDPGDLQLHSIAHGVITLEQISRDYGTGRRRLRVVKMRGVKYRGGFHDFVIETGGVAVFPRLIAAEHHSAFANHLVSTGVSQLDQMLGGGIAPGTNTLLNGPSGVGKTCTAACCGLAAIERGDKAAYFLFDEGAATLRTRARALGMDLEGHLSSGQLQLFQIDPAELSPGEFANRVRRAVERDKVKFIAIDSLNAFLQAMPGEKFLLLLMHELLSYLNQQGVVSVRVLGQHGIIGEIKSDVDLSYLSDSIVLFRYFEARGSMLKAASVVKSRTAEHETSIREFRLSPRASRSENRSPILRACCRVCPPIAERRRSCPPRPRITRPNVEHRILLLARRGRDAEVMARLLARQGHVCLTCPNADELARELDRGAGTLVVTEESLADGDTHELVGRVKAQPAWSDFPFILLATKRSGRRPEEALRLLEHLGNSSSSAPYQH